MTFFPKLDEQLNTETDGTFNYYAFAPIGTALATAGWRVFRIEIATNKKQYPTSGGIPTANYAFAGQNLSTLTYAWS